jgi:uncharacterized membrane protein
VTLVRLGMTFNLNLQFVPLTVLWAIGASMVVLSVLVFLPTWAIATIGLTMIGVHNAYDDAFMLQNFGRYADVWRALHIQSPLDHPVLGARIFALYPLIPWIGVMAAGYGFGAIVREPRSEVRRRVFLTLGLAITMAFVILRWTNLYGDPGPWSVQERGPVYTFLSFLRCQKYPPSLLYLLMTLGPAIASLAIFDRGTGPLGRPLVTFGRVPLFYYLLQWPLIHILAVAFNAARGVDYRWLLGSGPFQAPTNYGYSLPVVYAMWVVTVVILYVPCRWFADLKRRRRDVWLSYF